MSSKYAAKQKRLQEEARRLDRQPQALQVATPIQVSPPAPTSSDHFSAGVIYQKAGEVWYIAGITDQRFPNDVRIPGGTNKNAPWETTLQTLCRELGEELKIDVNEEQAKSCSLVNMVRKGAHTQYFFIVRNWSGTLKEGEFRDSDSQVLNVRWVSLYDFWQKCFKNHREGFQKAIVLIAKEHPDPTFREQAMEAGIVFHI